MRSGLAAVLFDLDGTLIDSAPDLAGAGNELREARGLAPLPFESFRPMVGAGARGMIGVALGVQPGSDEFPALRDEYLHRYEQRVLRSTRVFDAMDEVLGRLESAGVPWGIVTNKYERYTHPIVDGLGLRERAAAVVCGDTTPHPKPHPAPLIEAARQIGVAPRQCVYVGDDLRDIQAGRAASMATVAAAWGYLGQGEPVQAWGADYLADDAGALLHWLQLA